MYDILVYKHSEPVFIVLANTEHNIYVYVLIDKNQISKTMTS